MSGGGTCVTIGAAFENLEVESDREKVKKKRDAAFYVKDKQGRRRFHGAFTGGFSAGYYNTVGTEEGWAPSQFVSSRQEKTNRSSFKPEDFMDEEDLEEHGIAPRQVATKDEFLLSDKKAPKRPAPLQASILEDSLRSMIVPTRSTIGAQLLTKMGWRHGQGVGPRVAKKLHDHSEASSSSLSGGQKVYGCAVHPEPMDKYEEMMQKFLFAPDDVGEWSFTPKGDLHGIGYSGIDTTAEEGKEDSTMTLYGMSGQAFGVGALEEEDDDIYEVEKRQDYDRSLMDTGGGGGEGQYGWTGPHSHGDRWTMECFVKASKSTRRPKKYRCPPLPRDYRPFHKFIGSSVEKSSVAGGNKKQLLTAARRGHILGEEVSVFNLISPEDRRRIERAKQQGREEKKETTGRDEKKSGGSRWDQTPQYNTIKLPEWTKPGYKPFADDPAKQLRYEDYLSGKQETCSGPQYLGMTEWEKQRERTEFAKAADVYQPLATSLESKFTRGEDTDNDKDDKKDDTITRQTLEWHPHKILCRRFDVPEPYPHSTLVGLVGATKKRKTFAEKAARLNFVSSSQPAREEQPLPVGYIPAPSHTLQQPPSMEDDQGSQREDMATVANESTANEEDVEKEVSEDERPSMDLFKSIFTDSSASELSEDEASEEETRNTDRPSKVAEAPEPTNKQLELVPRQPSQPTQTNDKSKLATETKQLPQETPESKLSWMGVQHTLKIPEKVVFTPPANKTQPAVAATSSSHYGPALPSATKGNKGSSDSSDDEIVEVKKKHKKKHKKQVKQHKSHKRKHKHM